MTAMKSGRDSQVKISLNKLNKFFTSSLINPSKAELLHVEVESDETLVSCLQCRFLPKQSKEKVVH